jgi:hypothetical protein
MKSLRAILNFIPVAACFVALSVPTAQASPLRDAASEYKSAVKKFEIEIYERDYDRHSKRIVQDLEEAAIRMRSASSDTRRPDRLDRAWREILQLHPRVEAAFFGASRTCVLQPDFGLVQSWQRVNFALGNLAQAVEWHYGSYGAAPAASHLSPYPATRELHSPYGGARHGPGFQAFPAMPSHPGELRSSGHGDLPYIVPGSPSSRARTPLPFEASPMRPTFQPTPYDARSSYLAEPPGPAASRSDLIRTVLRSLIRGLDD